MRADHRYLLRELSSEALAQAGRLDQASREAHLLSRKIDEILADEQRRQTAARRRRWWRR